jgi:hypothetical protein
VRELAWHPMLPDPIPHDVLVLAERAMWDRHALPMVRRALRDIGGRRVVELREHGADHLLDIDLVAPRYTGAEGVWSDASPGLDRLRLPRGNRGLRRRTRRPATGHLARPRPVALDRLVAPPATVWLASSMIQPRRPALAVRLVPLLRAEPIIDLRLHARLYDPDELSIVHTGPRTGTSPTSRTHLLPRGVIDTPARVPLWPGLPFQAVGCGRTGAGAGDR